MKTKKKYVKAVIIVLAMMMGTVFSIATANEVNATVVKNSGKYFTDFWTHEISGIPRAHIQLLEGETLRVTLHEKEHEDTHSMRLAVERQEAIVPFDGDQATAEIDLSEVDFDNRSYSIYVYEIGASNKEYLKNYNISVREHDGAFRIGCNSTWGRGIERSRYAVNKQQKMNETLNPEDYKKICHYETYSYDEAYQNERNKTQKIMKEIIKTAETVTKDCKTDTEKAMALYEWIVKNIMYCWMDVSTGEPIPRDGQTGHYTYEYGAGVCNGIAKLYEDMLRSVGVPAVRVTGDVAVPAGIPAHAWVALYLEGSWHFSDPTDAVPINVRSDEDKEKEWQKKDMYSRYHAFCTDPQVFGMGMYAPWRVDKPNKLITVGNGIYKVTGSNTVAFYEPTTNRITNITIPATITSDGKKYKVTEISTGAFVEFKKLKSVTIGKNVTEIGNYAFDLCKALKTIKIKSTKIKEIGKSTFRDISKGAVIKAPKKALKKYRKMMPVNVVQL